MTSSRFCLAFSLLLLLWVVIPRAHAAGSDDHQLVFVPHCTEADRMKCSSFSVLDGTRLTTPRLQKGDILDIDIELRTSSLQSIRTLRSWVHYDSRALTARALELSPLLSAPFPSEQEIDREQGLVKIGGDLSSASLPGSRFVVARMTFAVQDPSIASVLSFYQFLPTGQGKTALQGVQTITGDGVQQKDSTLLALPPCLDSLLGCGDADGVTLHTSLLRTAPASLVIDTDAPSVPLHSASDVSSSASLPRAEPLLSPPVLAQDIGRTGATPSPRDIALTLSPETNAAAVPLTPPQTRPNETFRLLQIQNLRITTEGSSLLVAWQPLGSSALKGYNVYYGTVSGQYIQRRSIPMSPPSLTIRNLESGVQYYVSVRGFAEDNTETAFSEEASVTIGKPETASSPLLRTLDSTEAPKNPLAIREHVTLSGETGPTTSLMIFVFLSSIVGACFAWRHSSSAL